MKENEVTIEQAEQLYKFLSDGELPDGWKMTNRPKLGEKKAFIVIYYLQEVLRVIPDHFEQCSVCLSLYDDWEEGHYDEKSGKHYCGNCQDG